MAVILISGTVVVFKDEIDEFLNPGLLAVTPVSRPLPLDSIAATLSGSGAPVTQLVLPGEPQRPILALRQSRFKTLEQVAIDPYRGTILGVRPANGHIADILRQLHVRFYFFGATGRIVVGAFGVILAISGITGLLLYPRFVRAQRWREVRWSRGGQWIASDLHKLLGIVTLLVNLLWAVTGAVLGLENFAAYYRPARELLHPSPSVTVEPGRPLRASLDAAVETASSAIPGFRASSITLPARKNSGGPLVVYGNTHGSWTAPGSSWVALDPLDGRVLQVHAEDRSSVVTRIYNLHDPLHFGYFAGSFSRWLWLFTGTLVSTLPATGIYLWWAKRKRRQPWTNQGYPRLR